LATCCIADCQSAERQNLERVADCQSAIQQTASLRYFGCGSAALSLCVKSFASMADESFKEFVPDPLSALWSGVDLFFTAAGDVVPG
jgi:hypothetical protein